MGYWVRTVNRNIGVQLQRATRDYPLLQNSQTQVGTSQGSNSMGPDVKAAGKLNDHTSTSNIKFKIEWSYTSTPPYALTKCTEATLSMDM
jgi:hypothetical protein